MLLVSTNVTHDHTKLTYKVKLQLVTELLSPWKSHKYYIFVLVCVRGARARESLHARVHGCGCKGAGVCLHACNLTNPT